MNSNISDQARSALLQRLKKHNPSDSKNNSPITPAPAERYKPFPMTDMQQAYWLGRSSSLKDGDVAMHLYLEFISQDLDVARLQQALNQLIARHDMLRAVVVNEQTQQVLENPGQLLLEELDWSNQKEGHDLLLEDLRHEMAHRKADLTQWPQHRFVITRWPDGTCRLHFSLDLWCVDGRSYQVLLSELAAFYLDGDDSDLPELTLSFRDYVLYLQSQRQSPQAQRASAYWQRQLETLPQAPHLPLNPEAGGDKRFSRHLCELTPEQTQRFDARARENGITATSVLLTLYAMVLAKWSGESRFCLNIPRFNRPKIHPQVNQVIGEFATFSLLEVALSPELSFVEQVSQLQKRLLEDMDHSEVGGIELLRMLTHSQGIVANMPFVFTAAPELGQEQQSFEEQISAFGEVECALSQTPQVWLDCQYFRLNNALHVNWDVLNGQFMPGVIDAMFASFSQLFHHLCEAGVDWQQPWSVPLSDDTKSQWQAINNTERLVAELDWYQHFASLVEHQPDHLALVCGDQQITYQQLLNTLTAAAAELQQKADLRRPVAVWMGKSPRQIMAAMAVILAGGCYLPLDPESPGARVDVILQDAGVEWLISDAVEPLQSLTAGINVIAWDKLASSDAELQIQATKPDANAYLIYTSGSTGRPKGVPVRHESLANFVDFNARHFQLTSQDRIFALSAMHHDMSIFDLFSGLHTGATLVVPDESERRRPDIWLEQVLEHQITVWNGVPAAGELLVNEALNKQKKIPSLRQMIQGGDWVRPSLVARLREVAPQCRFDSIGGPTEITVWNITHTAEGDYPLWKSVPYGQPIQNSSYYILDEQLQLCPLWVTGEMYCGGVGVTHGYLNNEELNQRTFIEHPEFGRLYRSGDCGRLRPCGQIEFIGRTDNQVKLNGHRVELGELEQLACSVDGVVQAIALILEDQNHRWLGLAYEAREKNDPASEQLKALFADQLAAALLPRQWLSVEHWPLTENQKIDRRKLVEQLKEAEPQNQKRSPGNAVEQWLAELWQQAAGIQVEYADDNFFLRGGDSISATRLLSLVDENFEVSLSIAQIFTSPTLEQQAGLISEHLAALAAETEAV